ncbi:MAG TPA: arginase family protein [Candidatus Dojkabacteria bacterium]|nr:arginase family protein [Candidatus Dojkabacteria bacterium]
MKNIVVVKSKSRLGLKTVPYGGDGDKNVGVENGSENIVRSGIFNNYFCKFLELDFPQPENVKDQNYLSEYAKYLEQGTKKILENYDKESMLVNLGGDHSVAFMSLNAAISRAKGKDIGFIQIDSHGDIHNISTSPSGNFHGMWVRPFLDRFENPEIDKQVSKKLSPRNVMYLGNLDLETEERGFLNQKDIVNYSKAQLIANRLKIIKFMNRFSHLHISIDVDAFDMTIAPGTGIKAQDGLFFEDLEFLFNDLKNKKRVSIDLVEYNPLKDVNLITLKLIEEILTLIFENIIPARYFEEYEEAYLNFNQV